MAGYSTGLMIDDKPRIVLMRGLFLSVQTEKFISVLIS